MKRVDVAIVGAGPGGAATALYAGRAGLNVLLLDKASFPREKTCGDGITCRSLSQLAHMGLEQDVLAKGLLPTQVRFGSPDGTLAALEMSPRGGERPFVCVYPRERLDEALVRAAEQAGAVFRPGVRALGMEYGPSDVVLHTASRRTGENIHAHIVVAADGALGSFSQRAGIPSPGGLYLAARAYVKADDQYPSCLDFMFCRDTLPFYAWVFPVAPGLCNVGLVVPPARATGAALRGHLERLIASEPRIRRRLIGARLASPVRAGWLRSQRRLCRVYGKRWISVGDAAGLVAPISGEGIATALLSGRLAAQTIVDALATDRPDESLASYEMRLQERLGRSFSRLWLAHYVFYAAPLVNRIVRLLRDERDVQRLARAILLDQAPPESVLHVGFWWRLLKKPRSVVLPAEPITDDREGKTG